MSFFNNRDLSDHSSKFLLWGIGLLILGVLAISYSTVTTLVSIVVLGTLLVFGGIFVIIDAFTFWRHEGSSFYLHLLMGVLYIAAGLMLINSPVIGSISITILLAILYAVLGVFRIFFSVSTRLPNWGWNFLNGVVALVLGILILAQWPVSGLFVIGLFIGIDLLFLGWNYIMLSTASRR